jgi:zinc transporter ZupT
VSRPCRGAGSEIIPGTHRGKSPHLATVALLAGFALMMFLEMTLG